MGQPNVYRMIGRRAEAAGVATRIGCHSWRARGITAYLENGGLLEHAQAMAGHASARTNKLHDRRGEQLSLDEMERVVFQRRRPDTVESPSIAPTIDIDLSTGEEPHILCERREHGVQGEGLRRVLPERDQRPLRHQIARQGEPAHHGAGSRRAERFERRALPERDQRPLRHQRAWQGEPPDHGAGGLRTPR